MPQKHRPVIRAPKSKKDPKADCSAPDEWEEFRSDNGDPIRLEELNRLNLENMPEDVRILVIDDYFPESTIWRKRNDLVCEIQEHLYTRAYFARVESGDSQRFVNEGVCRH